MRLSFISGQTSKSHSSDHSGILLERTGFWFQHVPTWHGLEIWRSQSWLAEAFGRVKLPESWDG